MKGIKNIFNREKRPNWPRRTAMVNCWAILNDPTATAIEQLEALTLLESYMLKEL